MFLSVIAMGTPMLFYFSGPGSLKANTQWDASSQSCMYPTDGTSQASLLAGNLYMDLDNGTYLYRVLVCSLARLMFCFRLWILWEILPYSHSPYPREIPSCLYIVSDSCDGEALLAQPASWDLYCKHLDPKAGEPAVHAQGKMQSENKVNGSCGFSEGCFFKNQVSVAFFGRTCFEISRPSFSKPLSS